MSRSLEEQCAHLLRTIDIFAQRQYAHDGGSAPLDEYIEAGLSALCGCWARFDATRGFRFSTYAEPRIRGAIRDAAGPYRTWHRVHRPMGGQPELPHADLLRPVPWGPEDAVAETEGVQQLVATLPAPLQPYAWHVLEGGTEAEYARRVGWARGTVASWLYHYRQQYRTGRRERRAA